MTGNANDSEAAVESPWVNCPALGCGHGLPVSGRSYLGSLLIHALMIATLAGIHTPAVQRAIGRRQQLMMPLVAPLPPVRPPAAKPVAPLVKAPVLHPPVFLAPPPPIAASKPRVELPAPQVIRPEAPTRTAKIIEPAVPAPQPPVKVGVFDAAQPAAPRPEPNSRVHVGAFPTAAPAETADHRSAAPAAAGAFGTATVQIAGTLGPGVLPTTGAGFGTAVADTSRTETRAVQAGAGFGEAVPAERTRRSSVAVPAATGAFQGASAAPRVEPKAIVQPSGFKDAVAAESRKPTAKPGVEEPDTAVAILEKPRPPYTEEARKLKIEGEVWLEVLFPASGEIRVLRVIKRLGHGLDESATQAAAAMRFRPALLHGKPVDSVAIARITFRLAY